MARKKVDGNADAKAGKELNIVSRSIRKYSELRSMEQRELAKRLGIAANTLSNWENGISKPNLNVLVPICKALGISLYELFGLEDPTQIYSDREQRLVSKYQELSEGHKLAVEGLVDSLGQAETMSSRRVTRLTYFTRRLAAGIGDPADIEDEGEPIYLYSSAPVDKADYVFSVNGSSMEPEYHNGDMVLIKHFPDCGEIQPGEVGAFMKGNEAFIKEYQPDGLHSFNKRYRTMTFTEDDNVFFIGKVVGVLDENDVASEADTERYLAAQKQLV